ncbi:PGF-pre-PGF domain-containing protein [Halorussus limi]|uniref:PGF-pre-PGF domain-containing protein n=1 Tax=Halorussus limi TaxID=2938695 RepID=A0A8U0HQI0_9EURY|nr:PGF-pre-PGF domain-containing protein [Halorussus limi]UPV72996.1 PGF-pre-PGF domain-containing protein [Halorussus limi]
MTGGTDSKPRRSPSTPKQTLVALAVVGLVAAALAPAVGVAFADGGESSESLLPTTGATVSNPPSATGEETTDSAAELLPTPGTAHPGGGVGDPPASGPPSGTTTRESSERDTTTRDSSSEARNPGRGRGKDPAASPGSGRPADGPDEPNGPGRAPGRTPDHAPPTGNETQDDDRTPGAGGRPGAEHPPGLGGPPNATGPQERRSGPPGDRAGPPTNRTGTPGNGTAFPGTGAVSGNRTLPPNATERGRPVRAAVAPTVNVTVENASANEPVAVNVSTPGNRSRNVSFSTVEVTPARDSSFTLNVTASDRPIAEKTPEERLSNGTQPLAFLSVDHSISDRNISNVTFTFRVRRDRVNASERGEIALYRYHGESWNELPTTLVETTESHYVYRVRSPGLSEFAAGKQRPQFEITDATVELSTISVGDALEVQVRIANEGDADGTFTAELVLGDQSVARRQLTIAAGGMRQTTFERTVADPGIYEVYVNEFRVGNVVVNGTARPATDGVTNAEATGGAATDRGNGGTDALPDAETTANAPGLGVGAGVVSVLGFLLGARWRS